MSIRIQRRITERLVCHLDDAGLVKASKSVGWAMKHTDQVQAKIERHKQVIKDLGMDLVEAQAVERSLATIVREEKELRETEVCIVLYDSANAILKIRTDTGDIYDGKAMPLATKDLAFTASDDKPNKAIVKAVKLWEQRGGGFPLPGPPDEDDDEDDKIVDTPTDLAMRIKFIIDANEDGVSWTDIGSAFEGESHPVFGEGILEAVIWTLVNTGQIQQERDDILVSTASGLAVDIMATLMENRAFGTEKGPGDDADMIMLDNGDVPELADELSVSIFASDGATREELKASQFVRLSRGPNQEASHSRDQVDALVEAALVYLVNRGDVEAVGVNGVNGDPDTVRYMTPGQDLEVLSQEGLREVYAREVGRSKGRWPKDETLKKRILKAREERQAAIDEALGTPSGSDEPAADEAAQAVE